MDNKFKEEKTKNPIEMVLNKVGMQQEELAEALGVTRQTLSNYGKNPETIPNNHIKSLMLCSGYSYEELFLNSGFKNPSPFKYESRDNKVAARVAGATKQIVGNKERFIKEYLDVPEHLKNKALDEIKIQQNILKRIGKKTSVVIMGSPATGKTTLASYMMQNKNIQCFSKNCIYTCPIVYKIAEDVLGHGNGEMGNLEECENNMKYFPAYVDAEVLDDIELIDLPSNGETGAIPDDAVDYVLASDIIIFVLLAHKEITKDELLSLRWLIEKGYDLNRILIVKNKACLLSKKEWYTLGHWAEKIQQELKMDKDDTKRVPSKEEIAKRICYMDCLDPENEDLREKFSELFSNTVRQISGKKEQMLIQRECDLCKERINYYNSQVALLGMRGKKDDILKVDCHENEEIYKRIISVRDDIEKRIGQSKNENIAEIKRLYENVIDERKIEIELIEKDARKNKEYAQTIVYRIMTQLNEKANEQYKKDVAELWHLFDETTNEAGEQVPQLKSNMEYDALRTKYMLKIEGVESTGYMRGNANCESEIQKGSKGKPNADDFFMGTLISSLAMCGPMVGLFSVAALGVISARKGIWEKKMAKSIVNVFEDKGYLEEVTRGVERAYDQLLPLCDYLKDAANLIKKLNTGENQKADNSPVAARVMLCQSMVEMYYSIQAIVGA